MTSKVAMVVPCYNEAARLDRGAFTSYAAARSEVRFILVDDGSTDGTAAVLREIATSVPESFEIVALERNRGKAEAVRAGLLHAIAAAADLVGYWDADLATPLEQIDEFRAIMDARPDLDAVIGSRVRRLGAMIERRAWRHYLGRVFATAASLILGLGVYDTQCGAKLFRATDELREVLAVPFCSRWLFDVEILARLQERFALTGKPGVAASVLEQPLSVWHDREGSKLGPADILGIATELVRIYRRYRIAPARGART